MFTVEQRSQRRFAVFAGLGASILTLAACGSPSDYPTNEMAAVQSCTTPVDGYKYTSSMQFGEPLENASATVEQTTQDVALLQRRLTDLGDIIQYDQNGTRLKSGPTPLKSVLRNYTLSATTNPETLTVKFERNLINDTATTFVFDKIGRPADIPTGDVVCFGENNQLYKNGMAQLLSDVVSQTSELDKLHR